MINDAPLANSEAEAISEIDHALESLETACDSIDEVTDLLEL